MGKRGRINFGPLASALRFFHASARAEAKYLKRRGEECRVEQDKHTENKCGQYKNRRRLAAHDSTKAWCQDRLGIQAVFAIEIVGVYGEYSDSFFKNNRDNTHRIWPPTDTHKHKVIRLSARRSLYCAEYASFLSTRKTSVVSVLAQRTETDTPPNARK